MDKLKRVLSLNDDTSNDENRGIMGNIDELTTLSWSNRILGFCICFAVGIVFSLMGALVLFLHLGMTKFAIFYTLGNVISMASTCFLVGPFKQLKNMFAEKRLIATIIVMISFVLTIVAAVVLKKNILAFVCIVVQSLAMTWYSLSYIPYARTAAKVQSILISRECANMMGERFGYANPFVLSLNVSSEMLIPFFCQW